MRQSALRGHLVVTGGAGFIGSHLCEAFVDQGFAVTAVDNLVTGRLENLSTLMGSPTFSFVQKDISSGLQEEDLPFLRSFGLSGVLHFACPASPIDFEKIPFEILKVDSLGTFHTLELAERWKARYVLASTSEVYGDPLVHPQPESYFGNVNPVGPRACYDEAKRFAEACVSSAVRWRGLNGCIIRIFNTYGPRMRLHDGRVVPELCRQLLTHQPLTLHGTGTQTRSFCYVSDLVSGIIKVFYSSLCEPINLGNPKEYPLVDFVRILQDLIPEHVVPVVFLPARPDDPRRRCPQIQKATEQLGWEPIVSLREGLSKTLQAFQRDLAKA